jgi:hypothetical protein
LDCKNINPSPIKKINDEKVATAPKSPHLPHLKGHLPIFNTRSDKATLFLQRQTQKEAQNE